MMRKKTLLTLEAAFSLLLIAGLSGSALAMDVTLAWDANSETNLAGYKIYYDTNSGHPYSGTGAMGGDSPISVNLAEDENPDSQIMQFTIRNLPDGIYYIAVTAFTTEGLESGYSNEVRAGKTPQPNAPVLSSLQINGQSGDTAVYTNDSYGRIDAKIAATDDVLVSEYLILDGNSDPAGETFCAVPGGARRNAIFTISDFGLKNADGNHTVYAWVKDNQGCISTAAIKTNVILDRIAPTVAFSFNKTNASNAYSEGETVAITANFTDSSPIAGTPTITIDYAGAGSDITRAAMTKLTDTQWRYETTAPLRNEGTASVSVAAFDAAGNAVRYHQGNTFLVDSFSPGIEGFPAIDYANTTLTVAYSKSNMKNAADANNYLFDNGLLLVGNGTDISGTKKAFRFPLNPGTLQRNTIYTMQISSAVIDATGNLVKPNAVRINDNDNDGLADDWEVSWFGSSTAKNGSADSDGDGLTDGAEYGAARSNPAWGAGRWTLSPLAKDSDRDGMSDRYELSNGLNPVRASDKDLDLDGDGWSNYEEFLYGTAANNPKSSPKGMAPIDVVEALPLNNAGITPSLERIPNNAAVAVRVHAVYGLDISDPEAATFSIKDGSRTYTRRLNETNDKGARLLRAVALEGEESSASDLWLVYYRSVETAVPNSYAYDEIVEVTVTLTDIEGKRSDPAVCRFQIQARTSEAAVILKSPVLSVVNTLGSKKVVSVATGPLKGASIIFESSLLEEIGIEPYFGPSDEIPPLETAQAVGAPLNLLPPALFPGGVTLRIPVPETIDPGGLAIYYYDGATWVRACDAEGNLEPGGFGWMLPGSRRDGRSYVEVDVYHFSAVITARTGGTTMTVERLDSESGACFIGSMLEVCP